MLILSARVANFLVFRSFLALVHSWSVRASSTTSTAPLHCHPPFLWRRCTSLPQSHFIVYYWRCSSSACQPMTCSTACFSMLTPSDSSSPFTTPQLAASVLPYSRASWAHHFPDNRANALYRSHHVLLMEFCLASKLDSGQELIIQATVHPSMRNYILHYPTVHVPVESTRGAFSMKRHTCSCEDGCETHKHRRLTLLAGAMVFAPTSRCCSCRSHASPTRPSSLYV